MILNDRQIETLADEGMITPFAPVKVRKVGGHSILSYGLEAFGYTITLADSFLVAPQVTQLEDGFLLDWHNGVTPLLTSKLPILDVKNKQSFDALRSLQVPVVVVPPQSFVLGYSVERFIMPPNVLGQATGKSTYARAGITIIITPLEPVWEGFLTIEIVNTSSLPAVVYAGEGIAQILFMRGAMPETSYVGSYQNQPAEVVIPNVG